MGTHYESRTHQQQQTRPSSRQVLAILIASVLGLIALAAIVLTLAGAFSSGGGTPPAPSQPVSSLYAVESSSPVTDASGQRWTPDPYSRGGSLLREHVFISNTHSPQLYESERIGVTSLNVPLRTEGPYLVVLYFAETAGAKPEQRIFDVMNGGRLVAHVDVAGEVGALTPYHVAFTTRASKHSLAIHFKALKGRPILSAVRITPVSPSVQLPAQRLVWSDEFNGPSGSQPSTAKWTYDLGRGWGQDARYTSSAANASLNGNGDLTLAALPEGAKGYTSARLTTRSTFAMGFGAASARIRVAGQRGVVSTFWALGADERSTWPYSGEIDPAEVRGSQPKILIEAVHTHCGQSPCPIVWNRASDVPLSSGFHTFTVERAPGVMIYLLDGRQTASLTSADLPARSWVFDKRFYLLLNLIVGGWGSKPEQSTHWPIKMHVDWVRVFA